MKINYAMKNSLENDTTSKVLRSTKSTCQSEHHFFTQSCPIYYPQRGMHWAKSWALTFPFGFTFMIKHNETTASYVYRELITRVIFLLFCMGFFSSSFPCSRKRSLRMSPWELVILPMKTNMLMTPSSETHACFFAPRLKNKISDMRVLESG